MALQRSHSAAPCVSVDTVVRRHDAQILSRLGSFDLTADQFISRPARTRKHQSHPTVFSKRLRAPVENHSGNSTPGFQEAGYPIKDLLACTRIPVGNRLRMTDEIVTVDKVHGSDTIGSLPQQHPKGKCLVGFHAQTTRFASRPEPDLRRQVSGVACTSRITCS